MVYKIDEIREQNVETSKPQKNAGKKWPLITDLKLSTALRFQNLKRVSQNSSTDHKSCNGTLSKTHGSRMISAASVYAGKSC